ncbi:hypothetical protein E2C01_000265 [Portunus trituberculatus]|uniref:Uncharacterized protein n=1 Tax=Portunus trituberculatus TaxID=210409 RepID=A0A5B7CES0_PORTR|nr:hypothetical protein [Portunus trituberculatus]
MKKWIVRRGEREGGFTSVISSREAHVPPLSPPWYLELTARQTRSRGQGWNELAAVVALTVTVTGAVSCL